MALFGKFNHRYELNQVSRGTQRARLGDLIYDLLFGYNDLSAKYAALLAKLDAANLAGMGTNNVATLSPTARPSIPTPEQRDAGTGTTPYSYPRAVY